MARRSIFPDNFFLSIGIRVTLARSPKLRGAKVGDADGKGAEKIFSVTPKPPAGLSSSPSPDQVRGSGPVFESLRKSRRSCKRGAPGRPEARKWRRNGLKRLNPRP